jgi:MFS family permease
MYMGIIGLVFAVASCIGPIVGGAFTEFVTWRWCFYLNLPFDGVAFILLVSFLDIENPRTPLVAGLKAIDWLGSLLIVTGAVTLLIGLELGGIVHPWKSATTICLIIFGVVIMALFVFVEARVAKYPIMPIRLLRNRSNVAALATNVAHGFDFIAAAYFLPLYFQAVLGATPLLSGVYLLPFAFTLSMLATGTGIFIKKTGKFLPPIQFGLALMVLGFGLFISLPSYPSWAKVVIYQLILGVGVGCLFQSPLIALHTQVNPQDIATVTALFGFSRNFSTALSVVIGSAIFQNQVAVHANKTYPRLPQDIIDGLSGGSVGENTGIAQSLPSSQRIQVLNVYTQSLQVMWIFYTVVVFLGFLCTFGIATKKLDTTHVGTKRGLEAEEEHRLAQKAERQAKKEEKSQA